VDPDLHPDPCQIKKLNPDPHQGDKSNPNPDRIRIRIKVMRIHNTGIEQLICGALMFGPYMLCPVDLYRGNPSSHLSL
jgi:hypothetical protein